MKKTILAVACLATFLTSTAQEIKFGAKVGLNLSSAPLPRESFRVGL